MRTDMIFDVASLTKVVATTPAVLLLAERVRFRWTSPSRSSSPGWRGPVKERCHHSPAADAHRRACLVVPDVRAAP